MAEIDFGDNDEQAMAVMKQFVQTINHDFYGNGRAGMQVEMREFVSEFKGAEIERAKQHKTNTTLLIIIISILTMLSGYLAIAIEWRSKATGVLHSDLPPTYQAEVIK